MKDREEIVSAFKQCGLPGACLKCQYGAEREGCYAALRHDVLELLKEQPEQKFFVDSDGKMTPLPIQKHGHWIPIKLPTGVEAFGYKEYTVQEVTCSECKFIEDVSASAYLYCPNCGAKMNGEAKQNET